APSAGRPGPARRRAGWRKAHRSRARSVPRRAPGREPGSRRAAAGARCRGRVRARGPGCRRGRAPAGPPDSAAASTCRCRSARAPPAGRPPRPRPTRRAGPGARRSGGSGRQRKGSLRPPEQPIGSAAGGLASGMTSSARQVTWLFLLAPTLVLAACRSTTAPPPQPGPTTDLAAPDAGTLESRAMLLLMADRRLYDSTALELMLSGPVEVRRQLAVTLGQIGDVRGRSLLQGLLVDIDDEVRSAAAFALGELGAPEARRALIVAAVDDDPAVGRLAVEALGKIGAPLAEVRRALGALEADEAWARLAPSLFRFREPATVDAAVEGLTRTELAVRAGSAYALGREPRPDGAEALRGLLTDDDPFVRAWAARGLGEVGGLGDLARLLPLLDDA